MHVWPTASSSRHFRSNLHGRRRHPNAHTHLESSAKKFGTNAKGFPQEHSYEFNKISTKSQSKTARKRPKDVWSAERFLCTALYSTATGKNWKPTNESNKTRLQRTDVKGKTVSDASPLHSHNSCSCSSSLVLLIPRCFGFWSGCECETNQSRHIYSTNMKP